MEMSKKWPCPQGAKLWLETQTSTLMRGREGVRVLQRQCGAQGIEGILVGKSRPRWPGPHSRRRDLQEQRQEHTRRI